MSGTGDITLWINSPGGDCIAAAQIYNMLMDYKGNVTVKIDGIAASAASVIAMAGTKVIMSPVSMLMIHNPMTMAMGDTKEMEKAISMLSEIKESIINAYELKTGMSRAKIARLMDAETWMDAQKAVEYGFVDEVMFASAPTLTNGIGVLPAQTIHKLKDLLPARGEENAEVKTVTAKLKLLRLKGEMKDEV